MRYFVTQDSFAWNAGVAGNNDQSVQLDLELEAKSEPQLFLMVFRVENCQVGRQSLSVANLIVANASKSMRDKHSRDINADTIIGLLEVFLILLT